MFPWNYGFHWGIASYIFLGAFYTVLVVVAATLVRAFLRARRDLRDARSRTHPLAERLSRSARRRPRLPARPDRRIQAARVPARLRLPRVRDARETDGASPAGAVRRDRIRHLRHVVSRRPSLPPRPYLGASGARRHGDHRTR